MDQLLKYSEKCRLCLSSETKLKLSEKFKDHQSLGDALEKMLNYKFEFSSHPNLSQFICSLCESHLVLIENFRNKCIENDELLKSLANDATKMSEEEDFYAESDHNVDFDTVESSCSENIQARVMKIHSCKQCSKVFPTPSKLKRHENIHKPPESRIKFHRKKQTATNNACSYCDKIFKDFSALKAHLSIHENLKKYSCKYCNAGFNKKYNCDVHVKRHENLKQFRCDSCNSNFVTKNSYDRHQMTHKPVPKELLYVCEYCKTGFKLKHVLKRHIQVHLGLSVECSFDFCDKKFLSETGRRKHELKFHKNKINKMS